MADIKLLNPGVQADIDTMAKATRDMDTAVDDFVRIATANLNLLSGQTRERTADKLKWLSTASGQMGANFGNGTTILSKMIEAINRGDTQGANIMS